LDALMRRHSSRTNRSTKQFAQQLTKRTTRVQTISEHTRQRSMTVADVHVGTEQRIIITVLVVPQPTVGSHFRSLHKSCRSRADMCMHQQYAHMCEAASMTVRAPIYKGEIRGCRNR